MKRTLGCLAVSAAVIGLAVLVAMFFDAWSSPAEVERKIDAAIQKERFDHVYFEDRDALWEYVEKQGYTKKPKEVLQQEHDAGYEEGYEFGYSDGTWDGQDKGYEEGYGDGYYDGYNDCASGVPYEDQGPPI